MLKTSHCLTPSKKPTFLLTTLPRRAMTFPLPYTFFMLLLMILLLLFFFVVFPYVIP
ncbi:hypothetical protein AHAS_Ahas05G0231800 [Arachis hypogaea]